MQNKAPQGNPDPIPTPERELERYGVWVKAEPQDVSEEPTESGSLQDVSTDDQDAVLLSAEEEGLIDSFDIGEEVESSIDGETAEEIVDIGDFDSLEPLEEIEPSSETEEFDETIDFESAEPEILPELDESIIEDSIIDVELEDLEAEEPQLVSSPEKAPIPSNEGSQAGSFDTTEVSIEDFGFVDEEVATPAGPSLESLESEESFDSLEDDSGSASMTESDEFESLDMDLQFDDTIEAVETMEPTTQSSEMNAADIDVSSEFETVDIDSIGVEDSDMESASLDDFIDSDTEDTTSMMPELVVESVSMDDGGFDDIKALSDDLSSPHAETAGASEPSSDLLQKIALELSSIKEELVSLRSQLGSLKSSAEPVDAVPEPEETLEPEETGGGGFFDDEDDDTIALTGDELDNILNTADFTEESAADEILDEPESVNLDLPDDLELLPEDGNYVSTAEPGIETLDTPVDDTLLDTEIAEGVTPIIPLSEDTSFLESDEEPLELEGMPLDDVPLVEPNPSDLDVIMDSAFGDDEEGLPDIETSDDDDLEELEIDEQEPEIVLDIDADDSPVVSTVDSFPPSMDEIEDALELEDFTDDESLGGLDLHEESTGITEEDASELEDEDGLEFAEEVLDFESAEDESPAVLEEAPLDASVHPDEVMTSLDDSLFVGPADEESSGDDADTLPELNLESPDNPPTFESYARFAGEPQEAEIEQTEVSSPAKDFDDTPFAEPILEPETVELKEQPAEQVSQADTPIADKQSSLGSPSADVPDKLKHDVKSVLMYLDQLLASLPEEKIEEFASSEYYDTYKKLFDDLGLI